MLDIRSKAVTIDNCSSLFATICHCSPLFALFGTIRTIRDYSHYSRLFALFGTVRDYSLFGFSTRYLISWLIQNWTCRHASPVTVNFQRGKHFLAYTPYRYVQGILCFLFWFEIWTKILGQGLPSGLKLDHWCAFNTYIHFTGLFIVKHKDKKTQNITE